MPMMVYGTPLSGMLLPTMERSPAEPPLPESVAQNGNMGAVWPVFFGGKCAAFDHGGAKQAKVTRGGMNGVNLFRIRPPVRLRPIPLISYAATS